MFVCVFVCVCLCRCLCSGVLVCVGVLCLVCLFVLS